ncbi:MAG: cytochrome c3 family protein [Phycisphaerales bacterium]|nr:cytochrome c3 family protein [Phycisphaerales bacterium]MCB9854076.1 cytochrome c3 family protein [Phycisphaerales bacterium]MCB9864386.1 cytochrome c3 family protein [Phycisphaerales bacterium]
MSTIRDLDNGSRDRPSVFGVAAAAVGVLLIALVPIVSCTGESSLDEGGSLSSADRARRPVDAEIDPNSAMASGLIGSKHDFSQSIDHSRDLCTPCHVPHIAPARAPLLDKRPEARGRYRPYDAAGTELDATSMLCMSCHDGVIAPDVFTAAHGTQWARQTLRSPFGNGGATGHPIGIRYPTNSPTYHSEASVVADGAIKLPDGRIQCISCHDPHNTGRHDGMLVKSNSGSRLCLSCHRL